MSSTDALIHAPQVPDFYKPYDPRWDQFAKRVTVLIDSRDRDRTRFPSPTTYEVQLPRSLHFVRAARLVSAELPGSLFVFRAAIGNTTLSVTYDGTTKSIVIPDGNYTSVTMETTLASALETAFGGTWTAHVDEATHGMVLTVVPSAPIAVSVPALTGLETKSLGWYLGFEAGQTTTGTGTVRATRPSMVRPESYILLDIPRLGTLVEPGLAGLGGSESRNTFAKVPLQGGAFEFQFYDAPITHNHITPPVPDLRELRLTWRFHDGTPVEFFDVDHSITLELICVDLQGT